MAKATAQSRSGRSVAGRTGRPNVLFIMTDQQRFDTISALGNKDIYTPNLDRLVRRGVTFTQAYSTCPVCVAARYTIRTGCEPPTTRIFSNGHAASAAGQANTLPERCGPYLAKAMGEAGYRTFGVGKFHTKPWNEDVGFDVQLHSEELHRADAYAQWIIKKHPKFAYVEGFHGERTEMYYMPQRSALPAELTVESWVADRAVEQINARRERPYFGFVSFIGPHPPFAPPIPFNRMYDPDRMSNPVRGRLEIDHMDEQIPCMNHAIWAEEINDPHARVLKARYYGEISYIDDCLGRILDAVEARGDGENTVICFFTDHGDHLGDHRAWQKESFFEQSCHIPFLLSWPARLSGGTQSNELVSLADLFGIATSAAERSQMRDGVDILGILAGTTKGRETIAGYYGLPGTPRFKVMVRKGGWKYIFLANGGREQLFNLEKDPQEHKNLVDTHRRLRGELRNEAAEACRHPGAADALEGDELRSFPYAAWPRKRIFQIDTPEVTGFPHRPEEALHAYRAGLEAPAVSLKKGTRRC